MSENDFIDTVVGTCFLRRSDRQTLAISVCPDGSVELVAPLDACNEDIVKKVQRRRRWILRQQRQFRELNKHRVPLRYCAGATHRYLGKQYRIKVHLADTTQVKLKGPWFHVHVNSTDEDAIRDAMEAWLRERALLRFKALFESWEPWCKRRGLPTPKVSLRKMPKRWGSAGKSGRILMNPDLIRMPSACIDYVVAHEMCHLKHPHHGREFYKLLGQVFPQWRTVKERLEQAEW